MGASFLCCVLFWCPRVRLEPGNSAQSLECKLLESKHIWSLCFIFFFFFFFLKIGVGGRWLCPKREGVCTKDLETLGKLITSSETAFTILLTYRWVTKRGNKFLKLSHVIWICYFFSVLCVLKIVIVESFSGKVSLSNKILALWEPKLVNFLVYLSGLWWACSSTVYPYR